MATWVFLAVTAYILMAGVAIADKYFLEHRMPNALAYGFSVGVLGLVFVLATPFGFYLPQPLVLAAAIASGAVFTIALIVLFWMLEHGAVSRVIPALGALFPILTLIFASFLIGERLDAKELGIFGLLVGCGILLSLSREKQESGVWLVFGGAGTVAALYALSSVLAKYVFAHHPFLSGFIWMRLAGGATALALLLVPAWRRKIIGVLEAPKSGKGLLVGIRVVAGAAFITLHYAISMGPVTLINALKGIEYAAVFAGTLLVSKFFPQIVRERFDRRLLTMKSAGIAGLFAALWFLAR